MCGAARERHGEGGEAVGEAAEEAGSAAGPAEALAEDAAQAAAALGCPPRRACSSGTTLIQYNRSVCKQHQMVMA